MFTCLPFSWPSATSSGWSASRCVNYEQTKILLCALALSSMATWHVMTEVCTQLSCNGYWPEGGLVEVGECRWVLTVCWEATPEPCWVTGLWGITGESSSLKGGEKGEKGSFRRGEKGSLGGGENSWEELWGIVIDGWGSTVGAIRERAYSVTVLHRIFCFLARYFCPLWYAYTHGYTYLQEMQSLQPVLWGRDVVAVNLSGRDRFTFIPLCSYRVSVCVFYCKTWFSFHVLIRRVALISRIIHSQIITTLSYKFTNSALFCLKEANYRSSRKFSGHL